MSADNNAFTAWLRGQAYETPSITEEDADRRALGLLEALNGLPVGQARMVLNRAEFWLDATQTLDCGSGEFQRAAAALRGEAAKPLRGLLAVIGGPGHRRFAFEPIANGLACEGHGMTPAEAAAHVAAMQARCPWLRDEALIPLALTEAARQRVEEWAAAHPEGATALRAHLQIDSANQ